MYVANSESFHNRNLMTNTVNLSIHTPNEIFKSIKVSSHSNMMSLKGGALLSADTLLTTIGSLKSSFVYNPSTYFNSLLAILLSIKSDSLINFPSIAMRRA